MSWLNTLLDVGIIGMQLSHQQKLKRLQEDNVKAEFVQVIVLALRNAIFKYREAAREILRVEARDEKVAAAAMLILDARIKDMGLTPEIFPELSDKEYARETVNLIKDESKRLIQKLDSAQKREVVSVVEATISLPDYTYYIDNYEAVQSYSKANARYKELKGTNNGCTKIVAFTGIFLLLPPLIGVVFTIFFTVITAKFTEEWFSLGCCAGIVPALIACVLYNESVAKGAEYRAAKSQVKQFQKLEIDLERFKMLEQKFGDSYSDAVATRDALLKRIQTFFAGHGLPEALTAQ